LSTIEEHDPLLPEMACIVLPGDKEALGAALRIPRGHVIQMNIAGDTVRQVMADNKYVVVVHVGESLDSQLVSRLIVEAVSQECMLGFIVHPRSLSHLELGPVVTKSRRHAILGRAVSANNKINTPEFWYATGSHARFVDLLEWQDSDERPALMSFVTHSREDLVYAIDGLACARATGIMNSEEKHLPSCYVSGSCYRTDKTVFDIGTLKSQVVVLNGCSNFKLGSDWFDADTSLVTRLIDSGVRNVIGCITLKIGYQEEAFFIHEQVGKQRLGDITYSLNRHQISAGTGVPPYALWGDPRTMLPSIRPGWESYAGELCALPVFAPTRERKGKSYQSIANGPAEEPIDVVAELERRLDALRAYRDWVYLGLSTSIASGFMSHLEALVRGCLELLAEANYVSDGKAEHSLREKLTKASSVNKEIDKVLLEYLVKKTHEGGLNLSEAYRPRFIIDSSAPSTCPVCGKDSSVLTLQSPTLQRRAVMMCPRCAIVQDYPCDIEVVIPKVKLDISEGMLTATVARPGIPLGCSVESGTRYGFGAFEQVDELKYQASVSKQVRPHMYQLKAYSIQRGQIVVACQPFYWV